MCSSLEMIFYGSTDLFAANHADDAVFFVQAKADHGHVVVHSQRHSGDVCGLQGFRQHLAICQAGLAEGGGVLGGVSGINGVHVLRHQHGVGLNLHAAKHRAGVGGEVGVAGTGGKEDDLPLI